MKKLGMFAMAVLFTTACGNHGQTGDNAATADAPAEEAQSCVGEWVKPIEGQDGEEGFSLAADGTASSINRATLVYSSWEQKGDTVIVKGESLGNGINVPATDTLYVQGDSLVQLYDGNVVAAYGKRN
ncbi:MAG: lipocalin family protein [Bacteroidaceae bacterium]|nr:lipocalin family protein [Bacteroidaceae bacterium]